MTNERFIAALLGGCLVLILALGLWLLRTPETNDRAEVPPSAVATTPTPVQAAARPTAPIAPGHRLAGTVVGDARYAVVELPDGTNDLFRPGQEVPGLGRLIDVQSNRATFEGKDGRFEMQLVAAPTTTPVLFLRDTPPTAETAPTTPTPRPSPSASGSSPSGEPDRSAS